MSRIALGTAQFGLAYGVANEKGQLGQIEANQAVKIAENGGIDTIDTAILYGNSEASLGRAGVTGFKVVTKLPAIPDGCSNVEAWIYEQVEGSLFRLNTNKLYGLLLHRPAQLIDAHGDQIYAAMRHLKEIGKVQKIGISTYSINELAVFTKDFDFDLIQAPFNLIDRRLVTSGWLAKLNSKGIETHVRSVFLQGLLLMDKKLTPQKFHHWSNIWCQWYEWLEINQVSALQACISFALSFKEIDKVVVGIDGTDHLQDILMAANNKKLYEYPNIISESENLINPAMWPNL